MVLGPTNREITDSLHKAKEKLDKINNFNAEGEAAKAKAIHNIHGEKPSSYFCNLVKDNSVQKFIPTLITESEHTIKQLTTQPEVENEIQRYYTNLYKSHEEKREILEINDYLGETSTNITKVTDLEQCSMEGKLTMKEVTNYL